MSLPFVQPRLLRGYAAEPPPWHRGTGAAELEALLASRQRRLARLQARLGTSSIDLQQGAPLDTLAAVDAWTATDWPRAMRRRWADPVVDPLADWPRAGGLQAVAYTMVIDVGVALGEIVRRLAPSITWGVDRFEDHAADGAASFDRAVLLGPGVSLGATAHAVASPLDLAMMRFQATARGEPAEPGFLAGLRPVLWPTHRDLFVGPRALA